MAEVAGVLLDEVVEDPTQVDLPALAQPADGYAGSVHAAAWARVVTTSAWNAARSVAAVAGSMSPKSPSRLTAVQ